MAEVLTFDPDAFRVSYTSFSDESKYPNDTLQGFWDFATVYITDENYQFVTLKNSARSRAINLMAAHLGTLQAMIDSGETPGQVQSSTIDKISVTLTPPPAGSQFSWWLGLTGYGQQLLALLQLLGVGGLFIPGCRGPRGIR